MPANLHLELRSDPTRWRECNRVITGARVFTFSQQKEAPVARIWPGNSDQKENKHS